MKLTKNEFRVLVMLYAANIDGHIQPEEVEIILEKVDAPSYRKISKLFKTMSDLEVIDCIRTHKQQFATTPSDQTQLISDFRSVIEADYQCTPAEQYLLKAVESILKSDNPN